jgi:hypothetical protein
MVARPGTIATDPERRRLNLAYGLVTTFMDRMPSDLLNLGYPADHEVIVEPYKGARVWPIAHHVGGRMLGRPWEPRRGLVHSTLCLRETVRGREPSLLWLEGEQPDSDAGIVGKPPRPLLLGSLMIRVNNTELMNRRVLRPDESGLAASELGPAHPNNLYNSVSLFEQLHGLYARTIAGNPSVFQTGETCCPVRPLQPAIAQGPVPVL